jgi:hypothetical protein
MSWISDFERLKLTSKVIFLYFICIIPFFFISVYLFKPEMINIIQGNPLINIHFYFLLAICFALGFSWFWMVYLVSKLSMVFVEKIVVKNEQNQTEVYSIGDLFILTFIYSMAYIIFAITLNHYLIHWDLKLFLIGCFSFVLFRLIWIAFFYWRLKKIV